MPIASNSSSAEAVAMSFVAQLRHLGIKTAGSAGTPLWRRADGPGQVTATQVAARLEELVQRRQSTMVLNQGQTSLCGPAAFLNCLLRDRPDMFAKAVYDLWTTRRATINRLVMQADDVIAKSWSTRVTPNFLDWMIMASLKHGAAGGLRLHYDNPSSEISAVTLPLHMTSWFKSIGASVQDKTNVARALTGVADPAGELKTIATLGRTYWVVLLIDAEMLGNRKGATYWPTHWVLLNPMQEVTLTTLASPTARPQTVAASSLTAKQARVNDIPIGEAMLQVRLITWGHTQALHPTWISFDDFFKYYYGYVLAAKPVSKLPLNETLIPAA